MMQAPTDNDPRDNLVTARASDGSNQRSRFWLAQVALKSASVVATSTLLLVLLELPNIPLTAYVARPALYVTGALTVVQETLRHCWVNVVCLLLTFASLQVSAFKGWAGLSLRAVLLGTSVGYTYWILQLYEAFAGYPPFVGGLTVLWVTTTSATHLLHTDALRDRAAVYRTCGFVLSLLALLASAVLSGGNYEIYKGLYPTLHLSILLLTHLLLGLGVAALVQTYPARFRRLESGARWFGRFALGFVTIALLLSPTKALDSARPHVTACTMAGQARAVFHRFQSAAEADRPKLPKDEKAEERFINQSGLPFLDKNYLKGKNVLLVTWEATRFDHTSLSDSEQTFTPHLKKFFEEARAYSFTRAYSASSGTLHSILSVLGMRYPSALELETWKKSWHGELLSDGNLVPEVFARSGYHTFRISHSYRGCFRHGILGFHHGFDHQELFVEKKFGVYPDLDKDIASAALAHLKKVGNGNKPFFGWVFLGGPHYPYQAHYDDMPSETDHDRYNQEVRKSDEETGRLLRGLREMGRLKDTIVVFFGDHGEEFAEHGGYHHKTTVYTESTHVPLLIYLPGKSGKQMHQPVSTYYTFPWLLRTGPDTMREVARHRIREDIGPMMRATDGAVLIELIGHDRMISSLVYEKEKFNYDFLSTMYQVYNLKDDPLEQRDLFDVDLEMAARGVEQMKRYLTVRAARARFILKPEDTR